MNFRAIILSFLLLLPLVPAMTQEKDDLEAIPISLKEKKPSFDGSDEEAIRVIESAPQIWEPGELRGKPIDVTYTFPVNFKLMDEEHAQVDSVQFVAFDYGVKERKPTFNNGDYFEFAKWIREHLIYPEEAEKAGLEGRVYVSVRISEKGKLVNPVVLRSTNKIFEEEALRVIRSAPDKWTPGLNAKGEPMALSLLIPVNFNLPN